MDNISVMNKWKIDESILKQLTKSNKAITSNEEPIIKQTQTVYMRGCSYVGSGVHHNSKYRILHTGYILYTTNKTVTNKINKLKETKEI